MEPVQNNTFREVIEYVKKKPRGRVAVACAADEAVLKASEIAANEGILDFTFFDSESKIKKAAETFNVDISRFKIVDTPDEKTSVTSAVGAVRNGAADILMKGHLSTGAFLKAVLDREKGLRGSKILSHIQIFECPITHRISMLSDGGMNLYPGAEEFYHIALNAARAFYKICGRPAKIAFISSYNHADSRLKTSVNMATACSELSSAAAGMSAPFEVLGPVTLDVAISRMAARKKNIHAAGAGEADVMILPNIETGNILGKSLLYYAGAQSAGLVCGAAKQVIMLSRADEPSTKLNSMAIGALLSLKEND